MNITNPTAGILPASSADTLSTSGASSTARGTLGKDDFLKILVGQLQHQDPMQPSDDNQWIGQMAQFSELEQVTNNAATSTKIADSLNRSGALALIGRTVTYTNGDDQPLVTGTVQQVDVDNDGNPTLTVDGTPGIDASKVTQVK
jgi:flagellar basal-body rod modification protein FlgD